MKKIELLAVAVGLALLAIQAEASVTVTARDDNSGESGVALVRIGNGIMSGEIDRLFAEVPAPGKTSCAVSTEGFEDADSARIEQRFLETEGPLAERLLAALQAGAETSGFGEQSYSCALVVRNDENAEENIELGADESQLSIDDLARKLAVRRAMGAIAGAERARRDGNAEEAQRLIADAIARGESSDEVWRRAARLVLEMGNPDLCIQYLSMLAALNNPGAQVELRDAFYDRLRERQDFQFVEDSLIYRHEVVP